jgi:magnesium transporter
MARRPVKPETVGAHFTESVPRARAGEGAGAVLEQIVRMRPACAELICVTGDGGKLSGIVPLGRLLAAAGGIPLRELMIAPAPSVRPGDDQEVAASLALHHQLDALPVTDEAGAVLGVMPAQALMQVLRREHVEDLHVLAGIRRETSRARHAIEDPPLRRLRHRLPWLLLGLAGSAVATAAMAGFERTLAANVAVAFFVPGLVYLADAIGTQSEAIAVRGLSLSRAGIGHLLGGELASGMLIGAILGAACYLPVLLAFGDERLALAVSTALFVASSIAASLGLLLPWLLKKLALDPAYGSGPVATIVQDVATLFVYFAAVTLFGV